MEQLSWADQYEKLSLLYSLVSWVSKLGWPSLQARNVDIIVGILRMLYNNTAFELKNCTNLPEAT